MAKESKQVYVEMIKVMELFYGENEGGCLPIASTIFLLAYLYFMDTGAYIG